MVYVFDTNSFLELQSYSPTSFGSFWAKFDALVAGGEIVSVKEVHKELESQVRKQWLADWLRSNKAIFLPPTPDEGAMVAEIFAVKHFQGLIGIKQMLNGRPVADPFLIASARARNGCVVTEENRKENSCKIPNVCERFDVDCITVEEFIKKQGWRF